jgi:hypothetical protein
MTVHIRPHLHNCHNPVLGRGLQGVWTGYCCCWHCLLPQLHLLLLKVGEVRLVDWRAPG